MTRRGLALVLALGACSHGVGSGGPGPAAVAAGTFRDTTGERVGVATVVDTAGAVRLAVSAGGLAPGLHGLHFHEHGECTPPDFASAGPHWNPEKRRHGHRNPEGPHAGDLPNLDAGADGSVDTSFGLPPGMLGPGAASLLRPGGTALVIHARADDELTDPSGNSGARIACAVLAPG